MMTVYKKQQWRTSAPEIHRNQWRVLGKHKIASSLDINQQELLSNLCLFIYTNTTGVSAWECFPALIIFVQAGLSFNQCIEGIVFVENRGEMFGGEERATKLYLEMIKNENNREIFLKMEENGHDNI